MKIKYSTHLEDISPAFRNIVQWDDERIRNWQVPLGNQPGKSSAGFSAALAQNISSGIKVPRYHHLKAILTVNLWKNALRNQYLPVERSRYWTNM